MNFHKGIVKVDVKRLQLAGLIEIAAASLRGDGKEDEAIALFRLRIKIREGLSYEKAKPIFDKHTKSILAKNT